MRRKSAATIPISEEAKEVINISSNINQVSQRLTSKLTELKAVIGDKIIRTVAVDQLAKVKIRIHQEGKKSDGSQIGTYTNPYLKRRQKKPFNRTGDSKIILSLTRKMENEFVVIATGKGYGLGWVDASGATDKNGNKIPSNFEKAQFAEERFGDIYKQSKEEKQSVKPVAELELKEEIGRLNLR